MSKVRKNHGMSKTRLYNIWGLMKDRCINKKSSHYKWYGGRNIKICDDWKNNFMSFYCWAIENGYSEHLTLDRINNDGDYCPDNCRWVDMKEQCKNRRSKESKYITRHKNGWQVVVKQIYVCRCNTKEEAIKRRTDFILNNNLDVRINYEEYSGTVG